MIFGTIDTFAIEAITEPGLIAPSAVWGRMRVWCQAVCIGDLSNEYCALYSSYKGFSHLVKNIDSLWDSEFDGMSDEAILHLLDGRLYSAHGDITIDESRTLEEFQRDYAWYSRFNFLTNWGEQFDLSGKTFIFCAADGSVTILNRNILGPSKSSLRTSAGRVRKSASDFLKWFESETRRLSIKH